MDAYIAVGADEVGNEALSVITLSSNSNGEIDVIFHDAVRGTNSKYV